MTTIVEALDRIARQTGVKAPSSWLSATKDAHLELRDDFLLETVEDILDRVDLPSPIGAQVALSALSSATNADGSRSFTLPGNFRRLHRPNLAVYDVDQDRPCVPVSNDGTFKYITDTGTAGIVHFYQLEGYDGNYTLKFYRDPGAASTITVSYCTENWMAASGTAGSAFTDANDVLLLPRRLVEAGTVLRYRRRRGLPYQDVYIEYETQLSRLINDRRGFRVVNMGGNDDAVRWTELVPDFIPSS